MARTSTSTADLPGAPALRRWLDAPRRHKDEACAVCPADQKQARSTSAAALAPYIKYDEVYVPGEKKPKRVPVRESLFLDRCSSTRSRSRPETRSFGT